MQQRPSDTQHSQLNRHRLLKIPSDLRTPLSTISQHRSACGA
ncbi:MAG: hypothetical protein VB124_04015 [Burkholderia sp.]